MGQRRSYIELVSTLIMHGLTATAWGCHDRAALKKTPRQMLSHELLSILLQVQSAYTPALRYPFPRLFLSDAIHSNGVSSNKSNVLITP